MLDSLQQCNDSRVVSLLETILRDASICKLKIAYEFVVVLDNSNVCKRIDSAHFQVAYYVITIPNTDLEYWDWKTFEFA